MSGSNCCFLTCIQISQEAGKVVWYFHLFKNFPQFVVIHTVKGRRQQHPTPVLLPGKSHGQRSRVGCSPWGLESDKTERLHFYFSLSCIGEGNGNPLQCSCLENPRDGEPAGLPAMGSQSRTWLKRLSSSRGSSKDRKGQSLDLVTKTSGHYTKRTHLDFYWFT